MFISGSRLVLVVSAILLTTGLYTAFIPSRIWIGLISFSQSVHVSPMPEDCTGTLATSRHCLSNEFPLLEEQYNIKKRLGNGVNIEAFDVTDSVKNQTFAALFPRCTNRASIGALNTTIKYTRICQGADSIMQLQDIRCHDGQVVPIVRKCSGVSVAQLKRRTPQNCIDLSREEIKMIIKQVLDAVKFMMNAGDNGFWHSDFSPANVLYDKKSQRCCVIDLSNGSPIPNWFKNPAQYSRTIRDVEQYQYNRTFGDGDRLHAHMRRDDIVGLSSIIAMLYNITMPEMKTWHQHWKLLSVESWVKIMGRRSFDSLVTTNNFFVPHDVQKAMDGMPAKGIHWKSLRNECNKDTYDKSAFQLLKGLLQYSYIDRRQFLLEYSS